MYVFRFKGTRISGFHRLSSYSLSLKSHTREFQKQTYKKTKAPPPKNKQDPFYFLHSTRPRGGKTPISTPSLKSHPPGPQTVDDANREIVRFQKPKQQQYVTAKKNKKQKQKHQSFFGLGFGRSCREPEIVASLAPGVVVVKKKGGRSAVR